MPGYTSELYDYISSIDNTFRNDVSLSQFKQKMADQNYSKTMYNWIGQNDNTFQSDVSFDQFREKLGYKKKSSTGLPSQPQGKGTTSATVKTTTRKPSESSGGKKVEVFTNLPGKEANEYRVINNKWQRLIPNSNKWEEIKSDGAISYLNDYYKKNIPAPAKEPKEEEKPILGNMMTSFLVEGIAERDPEYKESEQYINDLKSLRFSDVERIVEGKKNRLSKNLSDASFVDDEVGLKRAKESLDKLYKSEEYKIYLDKKNEETKRKSVGINNLYEQLNSAKTDKDKKIAEDKINKYLSDDLIGDQVLSYENKISAVKSSYKKLSAAVNQFNTDKERLDQDFRDGTIGSEEYNSISKELNKRAEYLDSRRLELKIESNSADSDMNKLKSVAGKYVSLKEKQGGFFGGVYNSLLNGLSKTVFDAPITFGTYAFKRETYDALPPEEKQRLKDRGFTEEQSINYIANKQLKSAKEDIKNGIISSIGSGTTKEYLSSKDRGFFEKAIYGVAESLPAMLMPGGRAARFTALAASAYSSIEDEMLNDKDFETSSVLDRSIVTIPYAIGMGFLENLGVSTMFSKNPLAKSLITKSIAGAIGKVGGDATKEIFEDILNKEIKSNMAKFGVKVVGGALAEAETGALQSAALDIGLKKLYNKIADANDGKLAEKLSGGEYFDTPDSFKEGAFKVLEDAAAEAIGGFTLTSIGTGAERIINGDISLYNDKDVEFIKSMSSDPEMKKMFVAKLKTDMLNGRMTKSEAQAQLDAVNKLYTTFEKIPENISGENLKSSVSLIVEKEKIQREIEGKDESLVTAQKARITEIDNQLKTISENATKKSTEQQQEVTAEGGVVQRQGVDEGQPEVGQGEGAVGQATQQGADLGDRPVEGRGEAQVTARQAINRPAILTAFGGTTFDSPLQGDTYVEGQQVIFEDRSTGRVYELGNVDEVMDSTIPGLQVQEETISVTPEGKVSIDGNNWNIQSELPTQGVEYNPDGTVMRVSLKDDNGNTQMFDGQQAVDIAYQIELQKMQTPEQQQFINDLLEQDEEFQAATESIKPTEVEAVIEEETAPDTAQAEPTAEPATEPTTVEQPAVESEVEQLGKLLSGTDQQIEEEAAKISNKRMSKIVSNAARALSKIAPNVKFVIHENDESYRKATGEENRSQSSNGEYNPKTKTVHINLTKANARTVAHEVFHAILLDRVSSDAQANAVTKRMIEAIANKIEGNPELKKYLDDFAANYDQNIQNEEKLAELVGKLAENYMNSPQTIKDIIKRWLNKLAGMFSTKPITTEQEVMEVLNTIARKVATGKKIRERQVSGLIGEKADVVADMNKRFQADFSDAVSKLTFVFDKNTNKFKKLEEDGFITKDKSLSDFDGKYIFLHQPDAAFSGAIYKDGELLIEGKGGVFYPIKFHEDGYFWASTDSTAETMAKDLNKVMDQNGGTIYMALTSAPSDKLMSSTTMANAVLDFFSSKAFDKNFKITPLQLKTALRRAANGVKIKKSKNKKTGKITEKPFGLDLKLPAKATLEDIQSAIRTALGTNNSSFEDRKNFALELTKLMANEINKNDVAVNQFGKLFSQGIQNKYFKGITKTGKLKISAANMTQALSEMFTEPMLKEGVDRDKGGQVYAVLELNGPVKPTKSDKHESYPMAIQSDSDSKVKLHILNDRQNWYDVFEDFETNDIVTEDRRLNIYPTSGVSVRGLRLNLSKTKEGISPRKQLSAPNGKPSNLNEKQWNQVRTPEFKKWFGDWENDPENASKVVDENGEPMVVFHGSGAIDKFTEFSPTVSRLTSINASYFTDNPDIAKGYSGNLSGNLYEVFLNIREPLTFDFKGNRFSTEISVDMVNTQTGNNYTTEMDGDDIVRAFFKGKLKFSNQTEQTDGIVQNNIMDAFLPSMDSGSNTNFITTRANQIKSATENVGTFSNEERSIRKQLSGLLDRKQNQNASSIVSVARKNGFSEVAIEEYLRRQGFTDQQIQSAMSINDNINVNEIFDRSKKALREKKSQNTFMKALRFVWNKFIDRQSDIKRLINGIKTPPSAKAFNLLVTRAGAKGFANYRYKEAEDKIYKGLKEKDIDTLDKLIYVRRIISINENRADRGMNPYKGIDGYSEAEAKRDLEQMKEDLGVEKYNDMMKRADEYFKVFAQSLKNLYESGRLTEEVYNNLKDIEYSPIATIKYIIGDDLSLDEIDRQAEIYGITRKDIATLTDKNENEIIMDSQWLLMMNLMSIEARAWENRMLNSFADAIESASEDQKKALSEFVVIPKSDQKVPAGFVTVNYFKDGKAKKMFVKADYAVQLLDIKTRQSGLEAIGKLSFTQVLRFFATAANPVFIIGNTAVDFKNIAFFSDTYSKNKFIAVPRLAYDFLKNFLRKTKNTKKYNEVKKEFMEHGGGMDFMSSDGLRVLKNLRPGYKVTSTAQSIMVKYANAMSYLGETSELAFRIAVYEKTKENLIKKYKKENEGKEPNGEDLDNIMFESAREARQTVDFSQGGNWAKSIDIVMPYMNASLQGFRRPLEYAKKSPIGFASSMVQASLMSGSVAAMSLAALMSSFGDDDDEDEKKAKAIDALNSISEYEKGNYHIVFTGKKNKDGEYEYKRIKKLPVLSMVSTLTEQMVYKYLLSNDKRPYAFDSKAMKQAAEKSIPFSLSDIFSRNPLASAFITYYFNEDTFTGEEIFRQPRDKKIDPTAEGIYDDKVEEFYKQIAPALGLSPIRSKAFIEKIVTSENTNPTIAIFNAALNGIFDKKTGLGEEFSGAIDRVFESAGKKITRYTNKDIIMYNEMDKAEAEEMRIETDIYKKEQKVYNEIKSIYKDGGKMTVGQLGDMVKENFEKQDWERYVEKYYTYIQNMGAPKQVLDILYEKTPEVQALKFYNRYGSTLDDEEIQEISSTMRTANKKISDKTFLIYKRKYQRGN